MGLCQPHLGTSECKSRCSPWRRLQADTQKFKENVDPLIGGTDIIIFAFGADLTGVAATIPEMRSLSI